MEGWSGITWSKGQTVYIVRMTASTTDYVPSTVQATLSKSLSPTTSTRGARLLAPFMEEEQRQKWPYNMPRHGPQLLGAEQGLEPRWSP